MPGMLGQGRKLVVLALYESVLRSIRSGAQCNACKEYETSHCNGFEGTVILKVNVLTNGSPGSVKVLTSSGYDILDHSAIQAVQKWSFIPAKKGSDIIDQWVEIPIQFKLNSKT